MVKTKKAHLGIVFVLIVVAIVSCFFGAFAWKGNKSTVTASAETVSMDDKIAISTWGEAETGITWIHVELRSFTVAGGDWHNASASKIAANNNVDPLAYTYINGKSAREIYAGNSSALTVMTATGWAEAYVVKVSLSYLALGSFTVQLKAGFTLVGANGSVYTLQKDTAVYGWTNGNFGVVQEPAQAEALDNKIIISTWGEAETGITWIEGELSFVPKAADWDKTPTALIAENNGVNPCDYVLINGKKASEINAQTASAVKVRSYNWGENSYHFALKVSTAYAALGTFTVQYKAGLTLLGADGTLYELQKDTPVYGWLNGNFGVMPEAAKVETLDDKIVISSWGEAETGITWIEGELSFAPKAAEWDKTPTALIAENNNVNPCDYVLINGKTAKEINAQTSGAVKVRCYNWGENSYHFALKVSTAYAASGTFTVQYKAGLTLLGADGQLYELQEDSPVYGWTNGDFGVIKTFTLTFDGTEYSRTLLLGEAIGELPAVPEKDGRLAIGWAIDGVEITADSLYTYTENKTATPIYAETYTLSFDGLAETVTVMGGSEIGYLPAVPEKSGYVAVGWAIDGTEITTTTKYGYIGDKTATPVYMKDITKAFGLEDRQWGAADDEYYFGGMLEGKYFNTHTSVSGCWYATSNDKLSAANGLDIMQYMPVNVGSFAKHTLSSKVP